MRHDGGTGDGFIDVSASGIWSRQPGARSTRGVAEPGDVHRAWPRQSAAAAYPIGGGDIQVSAPGLPGPPINS